ncbi:YjcQ family protein [Pectinatus frisingensis]|uniref:YjcQ family protein n=1 Tax=Pectinatus frisingensis TaxID=865 RepID=UPI0018C4B512|nr:YjcQ family protein [Pectinatus frisingensis]
MNYSKAIFRILKTIDVAFENGQRGSNIFDLNKLGISDRRLRIILKSLYNDGYIDGIAFINVMGDEIPDYKLMGCHLTVDGMLYLENNSAMKQIYAALKEAKEWIP